MMCKFKKGFTLAEMLLSIIIIGVISAIAIPSLRETADMSSNIALLKKAHSTAANAFAQLQAELGPPMYWTVRDSGDASIDDGRVFVDGKAKGISWALKKKIASKPLVLSDDYTVKTLNGTAFTTSSDKIDDTAISLIDAGFESTDGMYWFPSQTYTGCQHERDVLSAPIAYYNLFDNLWGAPAYAAAPSVPKEKVYLCGMLMVDTNGAKKPNRMGIDVFVFDITIDGIVPHSSSTDDCQSLRGDGFTCSRKAIYGDSKALSFIYD